MEHKKIREIAEILGTTAIVASLVFVGLQLRQSDQIARAEIQATFGMMSIEIAALISDHSDVWIRGDGAVDNNQRPGHDPGVAGKQEPVGE